MLNSSNAHSKLFVAMLAPRLLMFLVGADSNMPPVVDSQTFLGQNMIPAGPSSPRFSQKVDKLPSQMTLREKIGQMIQLEISMVTDGMDQDVLINPPPRLHILTWRYHLNAPRATPMIQVAVTVKNTGNRDGKEVLELYLFKALCEFDASASKAKALRKS